MLKCYKVIPKNRELLINYLEVNNLYYDYEDNLFFVNLAEITPELEEIAIVEDMVYCKDNKWYFVDESISYPTENAARIAFKQYISWFGVR